MLKVITGKPGSGKSFHCVRELLVELADWCKYEKETGQEFKRKVYTNLPLNPELISEYIEKKHGFGVDAGKYIVPLDLTGAFWDNVPEWGLLVVDEVHEHLGNEKDSRGLLVHFRNYVATHRHRHHDIWMITQHLENVSIEILRIAEQIADIQNLKTGRIPFANVSFSDIDVVRRAFGSESQLYRVSMGRVVGRSIKWGESGATTHTITRDYFALYNSHSKAGENGTSSEGDTPSLRLSRLGAVKWFLGRHGFQLALKIGCVIALVFGVIFVVKKSPTFFGGLVTTNMNGLVADGKDEKVKSVVQEPMMVRAGVSGTESLESVKSDEVIKLESELERCNSEILNLSDQVKNLRVGRRIAAVIPAGIILADGLRVDVGSEVSFDGNVTEVLKSVNEATGVVIFESGKVIKLR